MPTQALVLDPIVDLAPFRIHVSMHRNKMFQFSQALLKRRMAVPVKNKTFKKMREMAKNIKSVIIDTTSLNVIIVITTINGKRLPTVAQ